MVSPRCDGWPTPRVPICNQPSPGENTSHSRTSHRQDNCHYVELKKKKIKTRYFRLYGEIFVE